MVWREANTLSAQPPAVMLGGQSLGIENARIYIRTAGLLRIGQPGSSMGELGHKVVCEIAYRLATPEARAEIRRLINVGREHDARPMRTGVAGAGSRRSVVMIQR